VITENIIHPEAGVSTFLGNVGAISTTLRGITYQKPMFLMVHGFREAKKKHYILEPFPSGNAYVDMTNSRRKTPYQRKISRQNSVRCLT
jgi:hypothetical protein